MALTMTNNVRVIRKDRGLTIAQLASISGVDFGDIQKLETGKRDAYPKWRKRIAEALDVPEEELFPAEVAEAEKP